MNLSVGFLHHTEMPMWKLKRLKKIETKSKDKDYHLSANQKRIFSSWGLYLESYSFAKIFFCDLKRNVFHFSIYINYFLGTPFICDKCNKSFSTQHRLSKHVDKKHTEIKCDICEESFLSKRDLLHHRKLEKHYPDEKEIYS